MTSETASDPVQINVGTTPVTVLAANSIRRLFLLQNVGTTVIKIVYGNAVLSQNLYHIALPAGSNKGDASSPIWQDSIWCGAVQALSSSSDGCLSVTELT